MAWDQLTKCCLNKWGFWSLWGCKRYHDVGFLKRDQGKKSCPDLYILHIMCRHTPAQRYKRDKNGHAQVFQTPYRSGFKLYCSLLGCCKTNLFWFNRGNTLRSSSAQVANRMEAKSPTFFWRSHVSSWGILEREVFIFSIRWDFFFFLNY